MKRTIVMMAAAVAMIAGSIGTAFAIEEDQQGWDCATMGNRICGPTVLEGFEYGAGEIPEDETVCYWDGERWLSAFSKTYGGTCTFGR